MSYCLQLLFWEQVPQEPYLDGPKGWLVCILFFVDIPVALVAFSAMWDGKLAFGILLWGIGGSAWWLFLGWVIRLIYDSIQTHKKMSLDI